MREFDIAAIEFTEDQIQVTVIRPTVMAGNGVISKLETITADRDSVSASLMSLLEDVVTVLLAEYTSGLRSLPEDLGTAPDDDSDSIEVR